MQQLTGSVHSHTHRRKDFCFEKIQVLEVLNCKPEVFQRFVGDPVQLGGVGEADADGVDGDVVSSGVFCFRDGSPTYEGVVVRWCFGGI